MRIISGRLKGKQLVAPTNLPARPTTDMAKESLFNLLQHYVFVPECTALDLFAGTGNISYELVSRGCKQVIAVDNHPGCVKFIQKTVERLNFPELQVVRQDALQYLQRSYVAHDIIFADPPYDYEHHEALVEAVMNRDLLKEDGVLIIEHGQQTDLSQMEHFVEMRRYGSVHFSFFAELAPGDEEE